MFYFIKIFVVFLNAKYIINFKKISISTTHKCKQLIILTLFINENLRKIPKIKH